jgi:SM-20-related protein
MSDEFSISETLDINSIKAAFKAKGRVEIADFLATAQADRLRTSLIERDDWTLVLNAGDQVYEIERRRISEMTKDQLGELERRVIDAGRQGFQYRYEAVRVPDDDTERQRRDSLLDRFVAFMSSQPVLDFLSEIIGNNEVEFADGQATAYSPGHFLTSHDDDVEGKGRHAAYVLGLAPIWRAEWGGLLMFHGDDGNIEEAFVPAMGALRLFAVPKLHSVSYVTPFAPEPRLSVTGWLRSHKT